MSDSDIKESKSAIVFDVFKRVALNYVIALEEQEGIKEGDGNSIGISVAHVYSVLNVIAIELKKVGGPEHRRMMEKLVHEGKAPETILAWFDLICNGDH